MSGAKTPNRRSSQIRAARLPGERGKREKRKDHWYSLKRKKIRKKKLTPDKVPTLMISGRNHREKKRPANHGEIREITFPPLPNVGSSDPIIIKIHHIIYCLEEPLCKNGNHGVHSPRSYKILHAQRYRYHLLEYDSQKSKEEEDNPTNKHLGNKKNILSCIDTKERMVINDKYPEQKITIGRQLPTRIKIRLRDLLKRYIDVFTWTSAHITGVLRVIMIGGETFNTEHQINVFNHAEPVKQKKRSLAPERNEAIHSQVEELTEVGILREVKYQTWVSNTMVVKKDNRKWKLRVDFTKINKAYIREPYPLPAAEQKAEGLHKYSLKCFLDAYKGYHQIPIAEKDEEKQHFLQEKGVEEEIYSGHLITKQGIRAEPSKVKAVSTLRPLKTVSEMQNLNKKIAALSRFLSKSAEKTLPFMKTLKICTSGKMVQWTKEADEAFRRMKECLESLPTMVIPTKGETLTMYLATSE
ncbi:hypothetical protein Tco_0527596 [Tanacetum coccineum]